MTSFKRRPRHFRRKRVACPECDAEFTITYNPDVRRFRARTYICPDCEFVGRRGQFPSAWQVGIGGDGGGSDGE